MIYGGKMMLVERNGELVELTIPIDLAGQISDNRIHNEGSIITTTHSFCNWWYSRYFSQ